MKELVQKCAEIISWIISKADNTDIQVIAGFDDVNKFTLGIVLEITLPTHLLLEPLDLQGKGDND